MAAAWLCACAMAVWLRHGSGPSAMVLLAEFAASAALGGLF